MEWIEVAKERNGISGRIIAERQTERDKGMTERQMAIMRERAERRRKAATDAKVGRLAEAREERKAAEDRERREWMFREMDARGITVWLRGDRKEPSCHAGGGLMPNSDWLEMERDGFLRRGMAVEIAENPLKAGEYALVRRAART